MQYKDYYETLGVERGATQDEIKKAYRRLARKYHPDVSTERDAEERFKAVGEAYEVLKDPEKRAAYDQFGHAGVEGMGGGAGGPGFGGSGFRDIFDEVFGDIFGGRGGGERDERGTETDHRGLPDGRG